MRHGGTTLCSSSSALLKNPSAQLGNILLIASLTKTLSESGTRNLDPNSIPISEPVINQILRKSSLDPSRKLEFFRWCCCLRPKFEHTPGTYSHMFRTLCRAGFLEEIPNLLNSMKEDGVVVGAETFQSLLDAFIRSGKFDFAFQILDHMEELGTSLNPSVYDTVIVALVKKKQVGLAMSIFLKLLEGYNGAVDGNGNRNSVIGSLPGSIACNALLVALRKADRRDEFNRVLEKLREKKGFELDTWGYNICIHAFGCWGDLATSLRLYKEMKEKSLAFGSSGPDLCTYNSLIHVLCVVGKVKDALVVWEDLKVSGHELDAFTYRILVQGCVKSYRIDDAVIIFNEMHINGFAPDTVMYNSLLDGLFKARKITEACQLFEQMVQDGVRASCWTYNIVIDGLFRNGRPEAGYTLFCDLKKKGQFVDAITYSIVALQLCKEGLLEEALKLVEEMEARGLVVDLVTITSLLIGFYKEGKLDWTERLMKHIRDGNLMLHVLNWKANMEASMKNPAKKREDYSSLFPTEGNYSDFMKLVINAVESIGTEEGQGSNEEISSGEADEWSSSPYIDQLADQLKPNERSSQPFSLKRGQRVREKGTDSFDVNMMNTYLSIFLSKGKLNLACKLFEIFTDMGVNPVNYTYNSIMSSFVKKGYFNEAWSVLNEMEEKICPADIATYNLIIQGLGKMGRADIASSVLDKLMKQGGVLDIVMYNTLINALGKAARVDEASKLFEQMRTNGINPDVVTFNTLIEVHTKAGRLKDAYKFLKMMLDEGCLPNHVTDTILDNLGKEIDNLRYKKASFVRDENDDSP